MKYKIIIQFALIVTFLTTVFFFYYKYFASKKNETIITSQNNSFKNLKSENNLIKDMRYIAIDNNGNKYSIYSKYGEISDNDSEIVFMKDVIATIEFFEKDTVYISSLSARYNLLNYQTNFSQNVQLKYLDNMINAENIDLSFQKSFAWIYKDIIYKSPYYELFADKIEIDLITKDSKIFMDEYKKVKIIKK
jgi:hypothetical protein